MIGSNSIGPNRPRKSPIIDWQGPLGNSTVDGRPGFTSYAFPADLQVTEVYVPTVLDEMNFNFHGMLGQDPDPGVSERVHLMHTTHHSFEEGKGAWCRYWYSDDNGSTWEGGGTLFPGMETFEHSSYSGPRTNPCCWVFHNGTPYAILDGVGGVGGSGRYQVGTFAVPVVAGTPGTPVLLFPSVHIPDSGFPEYLHDTELSGQLLALANIPYSYPWSHGMDSIYPAHPRLADALNGYVTEHSKIPVAGGWLRFSRGGRDSGTTDVNTLALWASFSSDGVSFPESYETIIPSAAKPVAKKFSDRYVLMANATPSRLVLYAAYSLDGLTWKAADVEKIRVYGTTQPTFKRGDPPTATVGKSGGTAYPDLIELKNGQYLAVSGERGKEIITTFRWTPKAMT